MTMYPLLLIENDLKFFTMLMFGCFIGVLILKLEVANGQCPPPVENLNPLYTDELKLR